MEYLKVATILSTVGLKGELRVYTTSTQKELRYKKNNVLFIEYNNEYIEFHIENYRNKDGNIDILKLKEINSPEEAEKFIQKEILALKDYDDLKKEEYFYSDLENSNCYDEDNNFLGKVVKVQDFTNIISLEIEKEDKKRVFVPFNDFFIKEVNIKDKKIFIHIIEGLF